MRVASLNSELCDRCTNDYAKQTLAACNFCINYTKLMSVRVQGQSTLPKKMQVYHYKKSV